MAQRCSGSSNKSLVDNLKEKGLIKNQRVYEAMTSIDRGNFCQKSPYTDAPQQIGHNVTISAPHMHAHTLQLLSECLQEGHRVLDVGSGSGYLTACMAAMVGEAGTAVGIDLVNEIVNMSMKNCLSDPVAKQFLNSHQLKFISGDGKAGHEVLALFDVIHVGAAAADIPPALTLQLRPGGRLIMPVGPPRQSQTLVQIDKKQDGTLQRKDLMGVNYMLLS